MKNVNFFLENLSNRVDFLTAKLMNSWKHIDMKQAINVTQNSTNFSYCYSSRRATQNMYFYQEETWYCTVHMYNVESN